VDGQVAFSDDVEDLLEAHLARVAVVERTTRHVPTARIVKHIARNSGR
jgi:hypothetical protein